ncbi:MAG: putative lipoprotein NlpE involved in copper resistance [Saprospiraceae bacterium]
MIEKRTTKIKKMKYLTFFSLALFLFSCSDSTESTTNNIIDTTTTKAVEVKEEIQKEVAKTVEKATTAVAEEITEQDEDLIRGTFMYYADAATFIECGTGKKFNVEGDDYLALEKEYMKQRTKDFEKIYVEVKGEIKMMVGMEGTKKIKTLVVDKMVAMNAAKSCN